MRLYFPANRSGTQKDQIRTMTVSEYIRWLKQEADTIRILPINRSPPGSKWSCTDPDAANSPDRFYPLVETFRDRTKTGFHGINATQSEREKISAWLPKARKDGYINIGKQEYHGGKRCGR